MDDAIEILAAAVARCRQGKQQGADVRLALGVLKLAGIPHSACRYFWESCGTEEEIGRGQSMLAALNRIRLYRAGKLEGSR